MMATSATRNTTLRRVLPEETPYTYSNAKFIHQGAADHATDAAVDRRPQTQQLFSLLQPVQYIPPFRYPFGATTIQATPYTKIAIQQRRDSAGTAGRTEGDAADGAVGGNGAFYLSIGTRGAHGRRRATSGGVHYLKSRNKFISPDSAIWSGALAHGGVHRETGKAVLGGAAALDDELDEAAAEWEAEESATDRDGGATTSRGGGGAFTATASPRKRQQMAQHLRATLDEAELRALRQPSTAEQLRAALDGRFGLPLKSAPDGRASQHRMPGHSVATAPSALQVTASAPRGVRHAASRSAPRVTTESYASDILAGNFSQAADMPLPRTFWSGGDL
jgi:hypothetical protein